MADAEDPLIAVARAMAVALRHLDFVPSDFAAALVLAGYEEREARALPRGQSLLLSAEAQDVGRQREEGPAPGESKELRKVLVEMAPMAGRGGGRGGGGAAEVGELADGGTGTGRAASIDKPQDEAAALLWQRGSSAVPSDAEPSMAGGSHALGPSPAHPRSGSNPGPAPEAVEAAEETLLALRRAMCDAQPGIREVVAEAAHFMDFALGAYGWCAV